MSRVHWLLGAHALAAGHYPEATESFRRAAQLSRTAGNRAEELLAQGFEAITKVVGKIPNSQGEAELTRTKNALLTESPRDAQFWIGQLDTAYRVFVRK